MGKKHKDLFQKIVDIDNLRLAYHKAMRGGNRYTSGHLQFKENLEANLVLLQKKIISGEYEHGAYYQFKVYEPKERIINALPFRDRVVQHAINNILEPIFDKVFYPFSFACRKYKGTHKGVKAVQASMRKMKNVYYLKMDFSKYFHKIDRAVLFKEIQRKISDKKVIDLLKKFGGDSGKGIPIGNLLSQLFANIYGHIFDRFVKTKLKIKQYYRYMDDTVVLCNDKNKLKVLQRKLALFSKLYMKLEFSKWYINSISKPLNFLGYRITQSYKLIRKDSATRAKRKIKNFYKFLEFDKLKLFLALWLGHIASANSFNLSNFINKEMQLCEEKLLLQM